MRRRVFLAIEGSRSEDFAVPRRNQAMGSATLSETMHRRILHMVGELHARGYERLRIAPGMAPSGCHWRCAVTPVTNISRHHGALIDRGAGRQPDLIVRHRTDEFGWKDTAHLSAAQMADLFLERFPAIAQAGHGPDPLYAKWYADMLAATEPNALPIAYADWATPEDHLTTVTEGDRGQDIQLPLPPPGQAAKPPGPAEM